MARTDCVPMRIIYENTSVRDGDFLRIPHFHDVRKSELAKSELQRRVLRKAVTVSSGNHGLDFMAQLQQRFEHDVVVMAVRDQRIIDPVGQVGESVSGQLGVERITHRGIEQNIDAAGLDQQAGVAVIANAKALAIEVPVRSGLWHVAGEEGSEQRLRAAFDSHPFRNPAIAPAGLLHAEENVERGVGEWHIPKERAIVLQSGGAEDEGASAVSVDGRERDALCIRRVVWAGIEQAFEDPERRIVIEIVVKLHVTLQNIRDFRIDRVHGQALRFFKQQRRELFQAFGKIQQSDRTVRRAGDQRANLIHPFTAEIDERAASHRRVFDRGGMHHGRRNIRFHDRQIAFRHVERGGNRRNAEKPGIPVVEKRLELDVLPEIHILFGRH